MIDYGEDFLFLWGGGGSHFCYLIFVVNISFFYIRQGLRSNDKVVKGAWVQMSSISFRAEKSDAFFQATN